MKKLLKKSNKIEFLINRVTKHSVQLAVSAMRG